MRTGYNVLVVDDSAFYRKILTKILSDFNIIDSVENASTGMEALEKIAASDFDLITLDVLMPKMNGLETLQKILEVKPDSNVLMLSAFTTHSAIITLNALKIGATDFITKPSSSDMGNNLNVLQRELQTKILGILHKNISDIPVIDQATSKSSLIEQTPENYEIIAIGASTGGITSLEFILKKLNPHIPVPIVIVQHIPEYFQEPLLNNLRNNTTFPVNIAEHGKTLKPSTVHIAPYNSHLKVHRTGNIYTSYLDPLGDTVSGYKPSIDALFYSIALAVGKKSISVILSGMGADGAKGSKAILKTGGLTIAQSPESSKIPGIITASLREKAIKKLIPLLSIPTALNLEFNLDQL